MITDIELDEEMEMPTPCQHCGKWFDLTDGCGSEKWHKGIVICQTCADEEEKEIERDDEIEDLKNELSDAEYTVKSVRKQLVEFGLKEYMPTGIDIIAEERQEHVTKHGRTVERDVLENNHYQLSNAAGLLTWVYPEELAGEILDSEADTYDFSHCCPVDWDEKIFNYMMNKSYKDRLIISGALIAAELDRLQASESGQ